MSYFKDWIFNRLPNYYHANDSYKDTDGKGLLQRYLENIGEDIDNNILPFIDNLLDIIDPTKQNTTNYKFLNHLAYSVGSPPDIFLGDPAQADKYAKLVNHIVSIYKIKGTKKSFVSFFALLGYTVNVIEWPLPDPTIFDGPPTFDDGFLMDQGCLDCSEFSILNQAILNNGPCGQTGNPILDANLYNLMVEMIQFLQPWGTILKSIITGGLICEVAELCAEENITFNIYVYDGLLDDPNYIMDSGDTFDQRTLQSTSSVSSQKFPPNWEQRTIDMLMGNIAKNATVYFPGTPQEKTGAQLWDILNQHIKELKGQGTINTQYDLLSKSKALYPFIGGSSALHALNLVDTSTFPATFSGTIDHTGVGVKGYTGSFADNGLNLSTNLSLGSTCMFMYNSITLNNYHMGTYSGTNSSAYMRTTPGGGDFAVNTVGAAGSILTDTGGKFYAVNRNNLTHMTVRKNGVNHVVALSAGVIANNSKNGVMGMHVISGDTWISDTSTTGYRGFMEGLTDNELAMLETVITAFQTALNRA